MAKFMVGDEVEVTFPSPLQGKRGVVETILPDNVKYAYPVDVAMKDGCLLPFAEHELTLLNTPKPLTVEGTPVIVGGSVYAYIGNTPVPAEYVGQRIRITYEVVS